MTTTIVGIDIAKDTFQVCLLQTDQRRQREFSNDPVGCARLQAWLTEQQAGQVHACLEATGRYGDALAHFLHAQGHGVSRVNPARVAAYARSQLARTKTDAVDAALIADFCRTQQPRLWTPPSSDLRELQALLRHLEALQQMHTQESNRLEADPPAPTVRQMLEAHLHFLDAQIASLHTQITATHSSAPSETACAPAAKPSWSSSALPCTSCSVWPTVSSSRVSRLIPISLGEYKPQLDFHHNIFAVNLS